MKPCHTHACPEDCRTLPVNMSRECRRAYFLAMEARREGTKFDGNIHPPEDWERDWMDEELETLTKKEIEYV